jgi:type IV pilus assembly protein PilZ
MVDKNSKSLENGATSSSNGAAKPNGKNGSDAASNGASRPAVVPLNYADKGSLHKSYMPFIKGGGLFMPTSNAYQMNDEIFLLVTLPGAKKAIPVPGKVVWISPSDSGDGKKQGVGVEFKGREGNSLRNTIEGMLGAKITSIDPTYTM